MATEVVCGVILVLGTILYIQSKIFQYYTKYTFFILASMVSATIFIPLMVFRPRDSRNALIPAWCCRQFPKFLGLTYEVIGHKNIVRDSGAVVVINHQSSLDLIVLAHLWPIMNKCTMVSKRTIFYLWPFGLAAWLWGTLFIDRQKSKDAQAAINRTSRSLQECNARILMFPEGTRHQGPTLLPFKKGAFHTARASGVPIQPVVVSPYKFLDSQSFTFGSGRVVISILPAIDTKAFNETDIDGLTAHTYNIMSEEYKLACAKV